MIQAVKAFTDSEGNTHPSLSHAQVAEIFILIRATKQPQTDAESAMIHEIASSIVLNAETYLDILTTNENSRPKARKVNGGRKSRKPKDAAPAPAEAKPAAAAA